MAMDEAAYLDEVRALQAKAWPTNVPRKTAYPFGEIPLTDYLRRWAQIQPTKPVYVFYGKETTFAELNDLSDRFAAWLAANGVKPGARVAVFLQNCPQFAIAFWGILKAGCIHVPVNPMFKAAELLYELNDTDAEVIVAQDNLMPVVREVKDRTKLKHILTTGYADALPAEPTIPVPASVDPARIDCPDALDFMTELAAVTTPPPVVAVDLDAPAALNYTGGTTGLPKGCVHTQGDMLYTAATTCTTALLNDPAEVCLYFHQMFWIAGENLTITFPVFTGSTCVLMARWDPIGFMAGVQRYRVTRAGLVVDNAVEVMEHPKVGDYDLTSLTMVRVSSFVKKLNADYRIKWRDLTGSLMVEAAWGMTETHTSDTFTTGMDKDDFDLKSQPIFVGLPVEGTDISIRDFETGALKPLGEDGELCVRSPSMLKSYWNKPEATADAIRNGWLHTGDIGLLDKQGFLHFLGRRKEMLKVKGMSVFPAEIEALLAQHPKVAGSGVVGRQDADRGEVPVAFVRIAPEHRGTLTEAELAAWCKQNMATYKVPEVKFLDELPLTTTGKVIKGELAKLLEPA